MICIGCAPSPQYCCWQKLYSVVRVPLVVILKAVPALVPLFPPVEVVPEKLPSVASTAPTVGLPPSGPAKLCSTVRVCAGEFNAVAAQNTNGMRIVFNRPIFFILLPFRIHLSTEIDSLEARSSGKSRRGGMCRNPHPEERA